MGQYYPGSNSPSFFSLCFQQDGTIRVFYKYALEPIQVTELLQMVMRIDRVLDELDYPKASMPERSFSRRRSAAPAKGEAPEMVRTPQELSELRGDCATLLLSIVSREHASWQGELSIPGQSGSFRFESVLDLCKLIDRHVKNWPCGDSIREVEKKGENANEVDA